MLKGVLIYLITPLVSAFSQLLLKKAADDRSLTGEEADEDVQSILAALKADHNAVLR